MISSVFCFIVVIIYIPVVIESVGIIVSADFFVGFYIHFYKNSSISVRCRSPPVNASFWKKFVLIGGFLMKDVILARFINYMNIALENKKIKYMKKLNKISSHEEELQDYKVEKTHDIEREYLNLNILNDKERQILNLIYIKGYSYKELSEMLHTPIKTLEMRRYRAVNKLKNQEWRNNNGK